MHQAFSLTRGEVRREELLGGTARHLNVSMSFTASLRLLAKEHLLLDLGELALDEALSCR